MPSPSHRFRDVVAAAPLLVGAVTFAVVFHLIIVVADDDPRRAVDRALTTPVITAWCVAVAGQVAVWVVLAPFIAARFGRYRDQARRRRWEIAGVVSAMLLLFGLLQSGNRLVRDDLNFAVEAQKSKVGIITAIGFAVALPCLLGMRFAGVAAGELAARATGSVEELDELRAHREHLDWFLSVAGLIVAGATLSTGLARNAFNKLNDPPEVVSVVNVFLYGAFCSAIIAAAYIPAHAGISAAARRIMTTAVPGRMGGADEWIEAEGKRAKIASLLGVDVTVRDRLTGGLGIAAPLAGSAISLIFPGS